MDARECINTKKKPHKWEFSLARGEVETISGDDFAAFSFFLFFFFSLFPFLWTGEVKSVVL